MTASALDRLRRWLRGSPEEVADHLAAEASREHQGARLDPGESRVPGTVTRIRWGVDGLVTRRAKTEWRGD